MADSTDSCPVPAVRRQRPSRLTSPVWKMFKKPSWNAPPGIRVKCLVPGCHEDTNRASSNTTSMMRHLTRHHKWEHFFCIVEGNTLEEAIEMAKFHRQSEDCQRCGRKRPASNGSDIELRHAVLEFLACDDLPITIVKLPQFQRLLRAIDSATDYGSDGTSLP